MAETFVVHDLDDRKIIERPSIERVMLWIQENGYFEDHPEQILFLTELFTRGFEMQINSDTSLREVQEACKSFNCFI